MTVHDGDEGNVWARRLRQLGSARPLPLWGLVALVAAFVAVGGLTVAWAAAGIALLVVWAVLGQLGDGAGTRPGSEALLGSATGAQATRREAFWRQIVDGIPDAAVLLDARRLVLAANARVGEVQPVRLGDHVATLRDPALLDAVEAAAATGLPRTFGLRLLVPVERHLAGMATPLPGSEPDTPAFLIVLRDRTEAEQLAEMRADFVANASHELRTPLASLKGFIETLSGAAKDDAKAREQFLAIMAEQAGRMSRLIDDLLSLSRIEMREHVAPTASVDVMAVVTETATSLRPLAEAAGIAVALAQPAGPLEVIGDRDELAQVIQNLVQNAIKYGKAGGKVEVSIRRDGRHVVLCVIDDGIGIAPHHLPRLTERFYRVSAKESRERGGTGLGLAIVKHIVNRHRGELRIESQLGRGSTFTVMLPAVS